MSTLLLIWAQLMCVGVAASVDVERPLRLDGEAADVARRWVGDARFYGLSETASDGVSLAEALAELAARLPAQPRTEAVLEDPETDLYTSPDVLWQAAGAAPATLTEDEHAALSAAAAAGGAALNAFLAARLPAHPQFAALSAAARRYEAVCEAGGWPALPAVRGRKAKRWKDTEAVSSLQRRLALEGLWEGPTDGVYDDAMVEVMKRLRGGRGMRAKGYYDADVTERLNVPCAERLATLLLNIKRWRHSAQRDEQTFVAVNIAAAELRYVRDGEERFWTRTIVGDGAPSWNELKRQRLPQNRTPVLADSIGTVILNPEWIVPPRIVREEIEKGLEKDPDYLAKHHMEKRGNAYVQTRGPHNALGQVKLAFPNAEAIYLHDTNKRGFFRHAKRDLSHGCVRVKNVLDLALTMVGDDFANRDGAISKRRLEGIVAAAEKTVRYGLRDPVPVFLEYYTADVRPDGFVRFFRDPYGYDSDTLGAPTADAE